MRQLTALEMELISGGNNSSTEVITIVYTPPAVGDDPSIPPPSGDDGPYGGGGGSSDPTPCPIPHDSPSNTNTKDLMDAARSLGNQILGMDSSIEHGAAIIREADGSLRETTIADGTNGTIQYPVTLAPGEQIVGMIHSHPAESGMDEREPSNASDSYSGGDGDVEIQAAMIAAGYMDPNALVYIVDDASHQIYEYQASDASGKLGYNITDPSSDDHLPGSCM